MNTFRDTKDTKVDRQPPAMSDQAAQAEVFQTGEPVQVIDVHIYTFNQDEVAGTEEADTQTIDSTASVPDGEPVTEPTTPEHNRHNRLFLVLIVLFVLVLITGMLTYGLLFPPSVTVTDRKS